MSTRRQFVKQLALGAVAASVATPLLSAATPEKGSAMRPAYVCVVEANYENVDSFVIVDEELHQLTLPGGPVWIQATPIDDGSEVAVMIKMFRKSENGELEQFDSSRSSIPIRIGLPTYKGAFTLTALKA